MLKNFLKIPCPKEIQLSSTRCNSLPEKCPCPVGTFYHSERHVKQRSSARYVVEAVLVTSSLALPFPLPLPFFSLPFLFHSLIFFRKTVIWDFFCWSVAYFIMFYYILYTPLSF